MGEEPWDHCGWTKSRYFSFIRSALRSATMRFPAKQKYLHEACRPAPKGSRFKYVADCEICGVEVGKSKVEVDHIKAAGSLKDYSDIQGFVERLFCGFENFQNLCPPCHAVKTLADKRNISFDEAVIEKEVIAFSKKPVNFQKSLLSKLLFPEELLKNQALRTSTYREHLLEKSIE